MQNDGGGRVKKACVIALSVILLVSCFPGWAEKTADCEDVRNAVGQAFLNHTRDSALLTIAAYDIGLAVEGYLYGLPVYAEYSVTAEGKADLFLLFYQTYASQRRVEAVQAFDKALEKVNPGRSAVGEITFCLAGEDQVMFEWKFDASSHGAAWAAQSAEWYFSMVDKMIKALQKSGSVFKFDSDQNRIAPFLTPAAEEPEEAEPTPDIQGLDGEWRWVDVEVDCPSCVGGVCPICHGTGSISMYGVKVQCDKTCSSCGGKGTFTQRQYHFFSPANSSNWLY